jgi:hypothetical protein
MPSPAQPRYVYLFGADREAAEKRPASFSAGGAGAVAC